MEVRNKYKVHSLSTCNRGGSPCSNQTFYTTKERAINRAKDCIREGCDAIVIYEAVMVITPTTPEICFHEVE